MRKEQYRRCNTVGAGRAERQGRSGEKMEDVIFNGTDNRKSIGMAEVNLILTVVTGQLPAGSGEYRALNNKEGYTAQARTILLHKQDPMQAEGYKRPSD